MLVALLTKRVYYASCSRPGRCFVHNQQSCYCPSHRWPNTDHKQINAASQLADLQGALHVLALEIVCMSQLPDEGFCKPANRRPNTVVHLHENWITTAKSLGNHIANSRLRQLHSKYDHTNMWRFMFLSNGRSCSLTVYSQHSGYSPWPAVLLYNSCHPELLLLPLQTYCLHITSSAAAHGHCPFWRHTIIQ